MFAVGLFMYPGLPKSIPSSYGSDGFAGVAKDHLPKLDVLLITPLAYAASIIAINLMIHFSPEKFSMPNSKRAMDIIMFGLFLLALYVGIRIP